MFPRARSEYGARIDVMTCGDFFAGLIGTQQCPATLKEWLRTPEENFAMSVNGEVFIDGPGMFTQTREALLGYYPEDVRRKRIAAQLMSLAQTGQYNHERVARRGDVVTLRAVISRFTDSAIALAFLLNRIFKPYYKWAFRALSELPLAGAETACLLQKIAEIGDFDDESLARRQLRIEDLCAVFRRELQNQDLSDSDEPFLAKHGEIVQNSISDEFLRGLPAQYIV